ncbi:MAG: N-acetylmuramoyl-L-alanine amidase [Erysipelotrichaceae bacterium]|nr:N-acetylmuramoyl-L-alanine amidase [Erysipelotrichaceae bacterium]
MKKVFALVLVGVLLFLVIQKTVSKEQHNKGKNLIIVIDPGHGGWDQGASRENIDEEDINLAVALYLKDFLETAGVKVIMTRTTDKDLAAVDAKKRKREDLKNRVEIMNQDEVDYFVSIHMNIDSSTNTHGSQLFFKQGDDQSKEFANTIQKSLKQLNQTKFIPAVGDYYILNETNRVGTLIECGFLSNAEERTLLNSAKYQQKLAYYICKGILNYHKLYQNNDKVMNNT